MNSKVEPIRIWNRYERREEVERVYGGAWVSWLYSTRAGQGVADAFLSKRAFSSAYGWYQDSALSRHKIAPFVRDFSIAMEEYEDAAYGSFNEFFIRKFKPGARKFVEEPRRLPALAEARYLAFENVTADQCFPVKGALLSPGLLLGDESRARAFEGGPLLIARLCPTDYHRFHFPDDGRILEHYRVPGKLHSVNPLALRFKGDILATNERQVSILETKNFGKLAYIEVGALCVGRIAQTHPPDKPFARGDEKGYFLFGASTVVLLGEKGSWKPDDELLEQTARQREVFVRLGDSVGRAF
ncbi:MAG: phosphatidylserine decarboxylase [Oligoflexia bacterium]|nr:phosphatidylserine decarboxylase [Oligoflexia bacterium]